MQKLCKKSIFENLDTCTLQNSIKKLEGYRSNNIGRVWIEKHAM